MFIETFLAAQKWRSAVVMGPESTLAGAENGVSTRACQIQRADDLQLIVVYIILTTKEC
jgi:hypothetical protein